MDERSLNFMVFNTLLNLNEIPAYTRPPPSAQGLGYPPESHTAGSDPTLSWSHRSDEPWDPLNLIYDQHGNSGQAVVGIHGAPLIGVGHNPRSDSGYGSNRNYQSAAHGSICDDTQSNMGSSTLDSQYPYNSARDGALDSAWAIQTRPEANRLRCKICKQDVKTKSELTKHELRHTKPFKCDVKSCSRVEGFSSRNDLDRHKRCKHPTSETDGKRYVCHLGLCIKKAKIWPRADNFRIHLKSVHDRADIDDLELETFVYKPPNTFQESQDYARQEAIPDYDDKPPSITIEQLLPSYEADDDFLSQPLSEPNEQEIHHTGADPQREPSQQPDGPDLEADCAITLLPPLHDDQTYNEPEPEPEPELQASSPPSAQEQTQDAEEHPAEAAEICVDESDEPLPIDSTANSLPNDLIQTDASASSSVEPESRQANVELSSRFDPSNLDDSSILELEQFLKDLHRKGVLNQLGYKKMEPEPMIAAVKQDSRFVCDDCSKSFPRKCELKKHQKRHEKPFVCSAPECNKRFGSKNDLKRHEHTKHVMSVVWNHDETQTGDHADTEERTRPANRRGPSSGHPEKGQKITGKLISAKENREPKNSSSSLSEQDDVLDDDVIDDINSQATSSEAHRSSPEEADQPIHRPNTKRRLDDNKTMGKTKRTKSSRLSSDGFGGGYVIGTRTAICCGCGELITLAMAACVNLDCQHRPCVVCFRGS